MATYGRSVFSLVCGLFTARWVLATLGEVDYGLYGVVGGLSAFVTFLNGLLASAVGRFYAFSVGEAKKPGNEEKGLEECRRWFSTAVMLHTLVPLALIAIGFPVGEWAVSSFLTIPADRVVPCLWVWRCVCVTCFVAMANVPYQAMYTAKQNIAELTIYSFVTTTLNVCVLYYMLTHPADWLVRYACWMMLMSVLPQLIIGVRAYFIYPECRLRRDALFNGKYLKPIMCFAGLRSLNGAAIIASNQGQSVAVNKYLGATANAAMTIGNQITSHAQSLASAFAGALYPAITNAAGEGKLDEMRRLAMRASKFATLSLLVFLIPLALEMQTVLKLWLVTPPAWTAELAVLVLVAAVLDRVTEGQWMSVFALGRIAGYQISVSLCGFLVLGLGCAFLAMGGGVVSVGVALVIGRVATQLFRLYFGRSVAGLSVRVWAREVMLPVLALSAVSLSFGLLPRLMLPPSVTRVLATSACSLVAFVLFGWRLVLSRAERERVVSRIRRIVG